MVNPPTTLVKRETVQVPSSPAPSANSVPAFNLTTQQWEAVVRLVLQQLSVVGALNEKTLTVKAVAGQTANVLETQSSAGTALVQLTAAGTVVAAGGVQSSGTVLSISPADGPLPNFWVVMIAAQTTNPLVVANDSLTPVFIVAPSGAVTCGNVNGVNVASHASRHQSGGADEIATTTPAAGAIPKATGDGVLPSGFIAENLDEGDLLYVSGGNLLRLPIGSEGSVLTVSGGVPAWVEA